MEIYQLNRWVIVLALLNTLLIDKSVQAGTAYVERLLNVPIDSILKTIPNTSPLQCLLRCRRSQRCRRAGMQVDGDSPPVCVHLAGDEVDGGCYGDSCIRLNVLEEVDTNMKISK